MKRLKQLFREFHEIIIGLLIIPVIWWFSGPLIHLFDPTAGVVDFGLIQFVFVVLIFAATYRAFNWIFIKISFPGLYKYIAGELENDLTDLQPTWYRIKYSLVLYYAGLFYFVLLTIAVFGIGLQ